MKYLSILALIACLFGCSMSSSNTVIQEIPSPNGKIKAVVFERNAGATTSFSTQISIIQSSEKLNDAAGNIFIADCNHGKAPRAEWGGPEVRVEWVDNNMLTIAHHSEARIFKAEPQYFECKINYVANHRAELMTNAAAHP